MESLNRSNENEMTIKEDDFYEEFMKNKSELSDPYEARDITRNMSENNINDNFSFLQYMDE